MSTGLQRNLASIAFWSSNLCTWQCSKADKESLLYSKMSVK